MAKVTEQRVASWLVLRREGGYNRATGESEPLTDQHELLVAPNGEWGRTVVRGSFEACLAVARLYDDA